MTIYEDSNGNWVEDGTFPALGMYSRALTKLAKSGILSFYTIPGGVFYIQPSKELLKKSKSK